MALRDEDGKVFAIRRIGRGATGFAKVPALIAAHGGGPNLTPSPIGTDKNLLVVALTRAGFTLCPINPRADARYRDRFHQSGRKPDANNAAMLGDILRTDRQQHRAMAISDDAPAA